MTLNKTTAAVVVAIGGFAFILSYEALYLAAVSAGINAKLAYLYPLIVEGFVTVSTLTAYKLRDHGAKATWYPWLLSASFFAFSLWANSQPNTLPHAVVRGVPSVALPFAVHLFTHMTKARKAVRLLDAVSVPEAVSEPAKAVQLTVPEPEGIIKGKTATERRKSARDNFLEAAKTAKTEAGRKFYRLQAESLA